MKILFGYDKRKNNVAISVVVVVAAVLASLSLVTMNTMTGYVSASTNGSINSTLSPDQLAAGGPLAGNLSFRTDVADKESS